MASIKPRKLTETEQAVADYLAAQNVNFSAVLVGATTRDNWQCDEWRVTVSKHNPAPNSTGKKTAEYQTAYFTGTGHRQSAQPMPAHVKNSPRSMAAEEWRRQYLRPVAPCAASVLYSLLSDAQGAEEPFDYWCSNYGYDFDSIKALNTYNACCEVRRELYKVFSAEQRAQLQQLLEDY